MSSPISKIDWSRIEKEAADFRAAARERQPLDADDLLVLTKFLAMLPGVKPRVTKEWLSDLMCNGVLADRDDFLVDSEVVTMHEANQFFIQDDWGTEHVSPKGAATLIRLYEAGVLPMKQKRPKAVPEEALTYAMSQAKLEQVAVERRERQRTEREAYQKKLSDISNIQEEEFTYRLLDDLFWRHIGKGEGTLCIGGLEVSKSLVGYTSNSGKSTDFTVRFTWASPSRGPQEITKKSMYADNRRNDAERNWGLPE